MSNDELTNEYRDTFQDALDTWGLNAQAQKAEEEAAEFIVASKHYANGTASEEELIDELADLRIMQAQLAWVIGPSRVEARIEEKIERLQDRLERD